MIKKWWFPHVGLFLILVLSYPEIFLADRTFHPGLIYPFTVTNRDTRPAPNRDLPFHVELSTGAYYEAPINEMIGRSMREGEFPLWNPHQSLGEPLLAQYSSRLLFPFQIVENLLGPRFFDFFFMARQLLAGLATFYLARALGALPLVALISAFSYSLSGVFTWFFSLEQFTNPAMVLPLLLLGVEKLTAAITPLRFLGATLSVALMMYAGQPEVALYGLLLGGLFLLFIATIRQRFLVSVGFGVVALCFGMMIAAPQILVFLEHLPNAVNHLHEPGGGAGTASPTPLSVMRLVLFPTLSTIPITPRIYPLNGHWDMVGGYLGILAPLLIVAGFSYSSIPSRLKGIFLLFLLFSLGVVAKNLGYAPFVWLGSLPLFDQVWSQRWAGPSWVLAAILAVSISLQCLATNRTATSRQSRLMLYVCLAGLFILCWLGLDVIPTKVFKHGLQYAGLTGKYLWPVVYLPLLISASLLIAATILVHFRTVFPGYMMGLGLLIWTSLMYAIPRGLNSNGMLAVELGCFIPILGSLLVARGNQLAMLSALAPAVCVLFSYAGVSSGLPQRDNPYSTPQYASFIKQHTDGPYRILAADGILYGNTASPLALNELQGIFAVPLKEYFHFYWKSWRNGVVRPEDRTYWYSGLSRVSKDLLRLEPEDSSSLFQFFSLVGIKYFILPKGALLNAYFTVDTTNRHLRHVYEDAEVSLYENMSVSQRAFFARAVVKENDADAILAALKSPTHDPRDVFIPKDSRGEFGEAIASDLAEFKNYKSNQVVIDTVTTGPRLLVLTDAFAPGWTAKVNGADGAILRVDHLFRGIAVPAGRSQIVLSYFPEGLLKGIALALIGLLLTATVALGSYRRGAARIRSA